MLDEILNLPEYPRGKRLFIIDMMKKFELCYDTEADKTFLVPDLLPKEQATDTAEDFSKLLDKVVKPTPNQKWYSVSIEGLIKAAENVEKVGEPVINLSRKVLSLLTGK